MPRDCGVAPGSARSTTAPAPSPNSTQVPRFFQSSRRVKVSAPITSAVQGLADAQEIVGDRQRKDEAGADHLDVEGGAAGHAQRHLHLGRGRGEGIVRRRRRQDDQVEFLGLHAGIGQRRATGGQR